MPFAVTENRLHPEARLGLRQMYLPAPVPGLGRSRQGLPRHPDGAQPPLHARRSAWWHVRRRCILGNRQIPSRSGKRGWCHLKEYPSACNIMYQARWCGSPAVPLAFQRRWRAPAWLCPSEGPGAQSHVPRQCVSRMSSHPHPGWAFAAAAARARAAPPDYGLRPGPSPPTRAHHGPLPLRRATRSSPAWGRGGGGRLKPHRLRTTALGCRASRAATRWPWPPCKIKPGGLGLEDTGSWLHGVWLCPPQRNCTGGRLISGHLWLDAA
jgi:hypothetical protein